MVQTSIWPGVSSSSCSFSTHQEFRSGYVLCSQKYSCPWSRYWPRKRRCVGRERVRGWAGTWLLVFVEHLQERPRDRHRPLNLHSIRRNRISAPLSCFSVMPQAIYTFPNPCFLFSSLDTQPDTDVLSSTRTQQAGVISCAPFPPYSCSHTTGERKYIPLCMEGDTLPKHDPRQAGAKIKFPPPRPPQKSKPSLPLLPIPRLAVGTARAALRRRCATAVPPPAEGQDSFPPGGVPAAPPRSWDFGEGSSPVFLFLLEVRKCYYSDWSGAMTHTNLWPSWAAEGSPPHPNTSPRRQPASGARWPGKSHPGRASVRFVSNKQPLWKMDFLAFPSWKCQLGFLMGYLTCLNKRRLH